MREKTPEPGKKYDAAAKICNPRQENAPPRRNAPKSVADRAPAVAGIVPGTAGNVPEPADVVPGCAAVAPGLAGIVPGTAAVVPNPADLMPGLAGNAPGDGDIVPNPADILFRSGNRKQGVLKKGTAVADSAPALARLSFFLGY